MQEQIAQLYVQILYSTEAVRVNEESCASSRQNEERSKEMVSIGKMSQADLAQLTAQRAQDEYNVVQAQSNGNNFTRQLKELLQITSDEEFDIATPTTTDDMALDAIPALNGVYAAALDNRPEFKTYQNQLAQNELSIKIARLASCPPSAPTQASQPTTHR